MEYRLGFASKLTEESKMATALTGFVPVLFQNPARQAQTDTAVSLWVSRAKYQFLSFFPVA